MKSNFDFLNRYWPALAQIGATAETYVYSDPNACIYKLGMFAERLVQEILVFEHIAEPAVDNTHANRIRVLKRAGLLPHEIPVQQLSAHLPLCQNSLSLLHLLHNIHY